MYDGFASAFRIFRQTPGIVGCPPVILFLTDGVNSGPDPIDDILLWNQGLGALIITYTFGETAGYPYMASLATATQGVSRFVPDGGDLEAALASYTSHLPDDGGSFATSSAVPDTTTTSTAPVQSSTSTTTSTAGPQPGDGAGSECSVLDQFFPFETVSYTHLTLPTILLV